ncbi:MAG: acetoin utilization protein AcuC [Candidatus Hodarchaeota archaeon]
MNFPMCNTAFMYTDKYLDYCPSMHPYWNITRFSIVFELVQTLGWFKHPSIQVYDPPQATDEEIQVYHHPLYVRKLKELSEKGYGEDYRFGLGMGDNPVFKGVHEASALITGGSMKLVDLVHEGEVAHGFAFLGGLHHAHPARASGFCYYNDPVLAIKKMLDLGYERVLYFDSDCHAGDGTQEAFYDNPNVLTISFHQSGRYLFPGTGDVYEAGDGEGEGFSVNMPFLPYTTDDLWLHAFNEIIPPLWKAFKPDFVYWQCGADSHIHDPLTQLQLTNTLYQQVAQKIHRLIHETPIQGRIILGGGGGYDPVHTAKAWSIILAELAEIDIPTEVPLEWITYCKKEWDIDVEPAFLDSSTSLDIKDFIQAEIVTNETINEVKERIFPFHGL